MESRHSKGTPESNATPRIYVASLADYNAGRLLGRWIEGNQSIQALREQVAQMLKESREMVAEGWAIHDYENFDGVHLSEFEDLEQVAEVARLIVEYGTVFGHLVGHFGGVSNVAESRRYMEEAYCGAFDRLADYVQELVEDCYGDALKRLPDFIRYHIDYEAIGHDLECGGDLFTINSGGVHVFDATI